MREELLKKAYRITQMSDEGKRAIAISALMNLKEGLIEGGIRPDDIPSVIADFTKLLVSADQVCNDQEYEFFKAVTGAELTSDEFYTLTNGGADDDFVEDAFGLIDILDEHDREALVCYAAALLSYDKSFKVSEFKLLDRIASGEGEEDEDEDEGGDEDED